MSIAIVHLPFGTASDTRRSEHASNADSSDAAEEKEMRSLAVRRRAHLDILALHFGPPTSKPRRNAALHGPRPLRSSVAGAVPSFASFSKVANFLALATARHFPAKAGYSERALLIALRIALPSTKHWRQIVPH